MFINTIHQNAWLVKVLSRTFSMIIVAFLCFAKVHNNKLKETML